MFFAGLILVACQKEGAEPSFVYLELMEVPAGFPAITEPADNAYSKARWELGKKLFFDPVMSVDSSISCASCHHPDKAFSDAIAFSPGVYDRPGVRNAPTLANVAYHPYFTREGGVPSLEMQVLVPIQEHNEFDYNIVLLTERLQEDSKYTQMAQEAYGRPVDPFVITRAIACFERSLLSGQSPYDSYQYHGQTEALTEAQLRGLELFFSNKTNCSSCHSGFNFTNYSFANNGLYTEYADDGRFRLTGLESDRALFKVPSLRNIAQTAPYMHDGSLSSLEEVIAHYVAGGAGHVHQDPLIYALSLDEQEQRDLIAFLEALTDEYFLTHPLFQP